MQNVDVFHFNEQEPNFEQLAVPNGINKWFARDLMRSLGYDDFTSFHKVINKAVAVCTSLGISVMEHFTQFERVVGGKNVPDFKLTRFACYLIAMNGSVKKPEVAKAQLYFVTIAESFREYFEQADNVERVLIRDEISERESSLTGVAKQHGINNYALFQNSGYRGMYNMNLGELKKYKGLNESNSNRSLLDFMGKEELAANLFRITQTEAKIKNEGIQGQSRLETAAENVGREVRHTMQKISGTKPEHLPLSDDIQAAKKELKQTQKKFKQLDTPKKKK